MDNNKDDISDAADEDIQAPGPLYEIQTSPPRSEYVQMITIVLIVLTLCVKMLKQP